MVKIVSANYRNRASEFRWLLRDENQHPSKAVEYKQIDAIGVAFCPSTDFEDGFGCSTVAYCLEATGTNQVSPPAPDDSVRLSFARFGGFFYETPKDGQQVDEFDDDLEAVPAVKTLRLNSDGSMYAVLPAEGETVDPWAKAESKTDARATVPA